jgi:hypothetical protein
MGEIEGSGPMGGQPSVFDSLSGESSRSPYCDHMTYVCKEGADARVLTNESEVHEAAMPASSRSSRAHRTRAARSSP